MQVFITFYCVVAEVYVCGGVASSGRVYGNFWPRTFLVSVHTAGFLTDIVLVASYLGISTPPLSSLPSYASGHTSGLHTAGVLIDAIPVATNCTTHLSQSLRELR